MLSRAVLAKYLCYMYAEVTCANDMLCVHICRLWICGICFAIMVCEHLICHCTVTGSEMAVEPRHEISEDEGMSSGEVWSGDEFPVQSPHKYVSFE